MFLERKNGLNVHLFGTLSEGALICQLYVEFSILRVEPILSILEPMFLTLVKHSKNSKLSKIEVVYNQNRGDLIAWLKFCCNIFTIYSEVLIFGTGALIVFMYNSL